MDGMTARVIEAAHTVWNREAAVRYILTHHTWEARARVYDGVFQRHFDGGTRVPSPAS
jgi:hypothetical protein